MNATRLTLCLVTALALPAPPLEVPFSDITLASLVDFKHEASPTAQKYLIETMGGGVAVFDYNNDGRLDIFFVNGAALADPMPAGGAPDKSNPKFWNRLYRQKPDGSFTDVTAKAGLSGQAQGIYGMGVAVGDYDNDGFSDLYVTGYGANTLYRNIGGGTFQDVTARAGVGAGGWSSSAGFFDYDNDGRLDLFVGRYVEWSFAGNRYCGEPAPGARAYCHPDNFNSIPNLLYRNNGDGTFTDVSTAAGIAHPNGKTLGVSFADYDGDGFTDVFVANDSVQCFLFHNNRNGTFTEVSLPAGAGFNEDGKTVAGMARTSPTTTTMACPTLLSRISPTSATCCFATTATPLSRTPRTPADWDAPRFPTPVGVRGFSISTTTDGRTSSSRRATSWIPLRP